MNEPDSDLIADLYYIDAVDADADLIRNYLNKDTNDQNWPVIWRAAGDQPHYGFGCIIYNDSDIDRDDWRKLGFSDEFIDRLPDEDIEFLRVNLLPE